MKGDPSAVQLLTSVDGVIRPSHEAVLPLPDDGLLRGDGVFEVIRLYGGRPFSLPAHLDRLDRSAMALRLEPDLWQVAEETRDLIEAAGAGDALVRIVCTRGGRRIISTEALPVHSETVSLHPVTYSPTGILNGVKSLSYAANMHATRLAKEAGGDEALLVRPDGIVLEAPTSTLFWVTGGRLRTTEPAVGVLDSITAFRLIERLEVETGEYPLEEVLAASEAFLASTTREVQAVRSVGGQTIPTEPAPHTERAAAAFRKALAEETGRTAPPD
jgi:branched-chain amino acid aminotransferase